jgi:hypothetical protein
METLCCAVLFGGCASGGGQSKAKQDGELEAM